MIRTLAFTTALVLSASSALAETEPRWSLAIHGGAGYVSREALTPERDAAYRAALHAALEAGAAILRDGGTALDAVQAAVELMEDDPLFNAGRGAVFTAAGTNELDAAIMDGTTLNAGSVAGVTRTRHPVALARAVMEQSPHVMLIGPGADAFAVEQGLEQVDPSWFFVEDRWRSLENNLRGQNLPVPPRPEGAPTPPQETAALASPLDERKFGTVGAVALDVHGAMAAATSTGGLTGKRWGRVGDVPVIGAGTYASNADGCAVSATGTGEYFIRATVARDICARIAAYPYPDPEGEAGMTGLCDGEDICLAHALRAEFAAARAEIREVGELGGAGGVIVMGADGVVAFEMNTTGMYRGAVSSDDAEAYVAIYADEE